MISGPMDISGAETASDRSGKRSERANSSPRLALKSTTRARAQPRHTRLRPAGARGDGSDRRVANLRPFRRTRHLRQRQFYIMIIGGQRQTPLTSLCLQCNGRGGWGQQQQHRRFNTTECLLNYSAADGSATLTHPRPATSSWPWGQLITAVRSTNCAWSRSDAVPARACALWGTERSARHHSRKYRGGKRRGQVLISLRPTRPVAPSSVGSSEIYPTTSCSARRDADSVPAVRVPY